MDRKRFIKEKARYAFIRERTRKIRERPRHRIAVPGLTMLRIFKVGMPLNRARGRLP